MRMAAVTLLMAGLWVACDVARAADEKVVPAAPVAPAAVSNAPGGAAASLAELRAEEIALDNKMRAVTADVIKHLNPIREARDKALKTDPELQAMFREIAAKQAALEKRLLEKFPDIAAKAKESEALTKTHSELNRKLMELRERIAAMEAEKPREK